jgi:hypothetical protein
LAETSLREEINVIALPAMAVVGLRLRDRKVVCCPAVQVSTA